MIIAARPPKHEPRSNHMPKGYFPILASRIRLRSRFCVSIFHRRGRDRKAGKQSNNTSMFWRLFTVCMLMRISSTATLGLSFWTLGRPQRAKEKFLRTTKYYRKGVATCGKIRANVHPWGTLFISTRGFETLRTCKQDLR
jgi:hypothetical protein